MPCGPGALRFRRAFAALAVAAVGCTAGPAPAARDGAAASGHTSPSTGAPPSAGASAAPVAPPASAASAPVPPSAVASAAPVPPPASASAAPVGRVRVSAGPLGAPVLGVPSDDWHINDHAIVRGPDRTFHFFGIYARNPPRPAPAPGEGHGRGRSFGHATSAALAAGWAFREDRPFYERVGGKGVLWAPHVVWDGSRYHMFYCTGGEPEAFAISRRTSTDLVSWSEPEVLFRDGWQARDPMVLRIEGERRWALYYTATEDPAAASHHVVAMRTSPDLDRWSERQIVFVDEHVGKGYGPTESPFVVERRGLYYLFVGPRPYDAPSRGHPNWEHPGYVGTDVFESRRFDHFSPAGLVGHVAAHAAEVVEDDEGRSFVTSAGIRQGGLYLAPLDWGD